MTPASALASLRWSRTSQAERRAAASHAARERWRKHREKQGKK